MNATTIRQRTVSLIKELNVKRVDFAQAIGGSRTSLYQWLNDEHRDFPAILNVPAVYPQVSCEWFFRGTGAMFLEDSKRPGVSIPEDYNHFIATEATATASAFSNGSAKATANTSGHASAHSIGNAHATAETIPASVISLADGLTHQELLAFLSHKIEETQKLLAIYNGMIQQSLNKQ